MTTKLPKVAISVDACLANGLSIEMLITRRLGRAPDVALGEPSRWVPIEYLREIHIVGSMKDE